MIRLMAKIDIRKLNAQKKYAGSMEFDFDAPASLIEIPFTKFSAPVKVRFDYDLYEDDAFEIRGTVSYCIEGQCSRCLKEAKQSVTGELVALFEERKDPEDYGYQNGVVDLTRALEDAIMASMPFSLSCGEDCTGLDGFTDK